uniref:MG-160, putative n=1 Tax=Riptortus pedestris TaxID=329032 RepID=R4WDQ7_RIPPE|nr:MG-160, putative [Riptortus pedestris]
MRLINAKIEVKMVSCQLIFIFCVLSLFSIVTSQRFPNKKIQSAGVYFGPSEIKKSGKCEILNKVCGNISDDLDTLECAHTYKEHPNRITDLIDEACQHLIWNYTIELMKDSKLKPLVRQFCQDIPLYEKCSSEHRTRFLSCLFDNINDYPYPSTCSKNIERLKFLTFLDQRVLFMFIENCNDDVSKFQCGRLPNKDISGSATLSCLQRNLLGLQKGCQNQVLRLSELQAENIKYDQQLFTSCADEQRFFCNNVGIGKGLMYLCLIQHREEPQMSEKCKIELLRHERLIAQDYQVSRGLVRACKEDIKLNRCRKSVSDDRDIRLAQILVCLENATKNGNTTVNSKCREEMLAHRNMLLQDYRLSPEIVSACSNDIVNFCKKGTEFGEKTIHCLMEHSKARRRKYRVSDACQRQLEVLIKETDAGEDWRVDPILWKACQSVVHVGCNKFPAGDARVMSCLMEKLDTEVMTEECETPLRQLQHFIARDYKLDPPLYKACREAAIKYCSAKGVWASSPLSTDPERGPLILPCLYSRAISPEYKLNQECIVELKRVMRQRAISVDLHPNIELFCVEDLSKFCLDKTGKGEEMLCLQDHLEMLSPNCKVQVFNFTEVQAENIELNPIIATNCKIVIEDLCEETLSKGKEQDVMDCLIEHKNDQLMKLHNKCRASVEHYQLISLKDYHFTLKFKRACKDHVSRFCPGVRDKAEVVRCLSEVIRNETLTDSKPRVSKECHQQLKAQLLQQRESIDLNPSLKANCSDDISRFCSNVQPGNAKVLECLIIHKYNLTLACRKRIFYVEKQELADSWIDYTLLNTCKTMLQKYCNKTDLSPLTCLKKYKYNSEFDYKCRAIILRRISDLNTNYQLNPGLQTDCRKDISSYCSEALSEKSDPKHLEDKVINCLKIQFRNGKLEMKCRNQVISILREAAMNYQLNPLLATLCSSEIKQLCDTDADNIGKGEVEECLKEALKNGQIKNTLCKLEIVELLQESKADVRADPHLYKSCNKDITQHCSSVAEGNGRQLDCLIKIVQEIPHALTKHCEETLKERIEMYKIIPEQKVESLSQLYGQVSHSPSKKYFIVVAFTFIGLIFITGMFCGRAMRRSIAGKRK